jgi:hypothetical protein
MNTPNIIDSRKNKYVVNRSALVGSKAICTKEKKAKEIPIIIK